MKQNDWAVEPNGWRGSEQAQTFTVSNVKYCFQFLQSEKKISPCRFCFQPLRGNLFRAASFSFPDCTIRLIKFQKNVFPRRSGVELLMVPWMTGSIEDFITRGSNNTWISLEVKIFPMRNTRNFSKSIQILLWTRIDI